MKTPVSLVVVFFVLLSAMMFAAGRSSTPYKAIHDLPAGHYTVECNRSQEDGVVLSLVSNEAHRTYLVHFRRELPAAFQVISGSTLQGRGYSHGYHIFDTTSEEPKHFWSNIDQT